MDFNLNFVSIINFYKDGFKNMTVGKTLWKMIAIKLLIIFGLIHYFIDDKSIDSEYKSDQAKSDFVYNNLTKEKGK